MKNKIKRYNKKDIINKVSNKTGFFKKDIETIYDVTSEIIEELLLSTQDKETTEIKLIDGLKIYGVYVPERIMPNNLISHIPLKTPQNILLSARFSHGYKEKIKEIYRKNKNL